MNYILRLIDRMAWLTCTLFFGGIFSIYVGMGVSGLGHHIGEKFAVMIVTMLPLVVCFICPSAYKHQDLSFIQFMVIPLIIGVFLCAWSEWNLHWAWALLLAAPGLMFSTPRMIDNSSQWIGKIFIKKD